MSEINAALLQRIRNGLVKRAFVPMGPGGAQTPPPQDPNMSGPPMMPPGGQPGMPPGGDPSAGGGDPSAGGGDPSAGGAPGGDPSTAGIPGSGQPIMLQMQDLMQILQMAGGGGGAGAGAGAGAAGGAGDGKGKGGGAKELSVKVDAIASDLAQIKSFIMGATGGQGMGDGQGGAMPSMGSGVGSDMAPPTPMMPGQPGGAPPGMDPSMVQGMDPSMQGGAPQGGAPQGGGMQVQASFRPKTAAAVPPMPKAKVLSGIISRLNR
jgi:hypothetical protein